MSSEADRVRLLAGILGGGLDPRVELGIGDDAAVLRPGTGALVWTIDASVEGVHFRRDLLSLEDVGYRATMAAASDLAAMGAGPLGLLAALVLPLGFTDADLAALAAGQRQAADELGTTLAGGNLARGGELSITTTAIGTTPRPLRRDGARPGDALCLAGPVGLAAAGLALLQAPPDAAAGALAPASAGAVARALQAWRRPVARLAAGLASRERAHAAINVSDGLAQDLGHLARASGIRALLDAAALASPDLAALGLLTGRDPLDLALHGGEDYALLVAVPPDAVPAGFSPVGVCQPPDAGAALITLRRADGSVLPVEPRGFDHFAR